MSLHVSVSGNGPKLILLHGWAMHSGIFAPLLPAEFVVIRIGVWSHRDP